MNKIVTLSVFILLIINASSQKRISGLGELKIDSITTSYITQLSEKLGIPIKSTFDGFDIYKIKIKGSNSTSNIVKIEKAVLEDGDPDKFLSSTDNNYINLPNTSVYYIDYLEISSVSVRDIYLSFYKDTLFKIHCSLSDELLDAMNLKYGEPKIRLDEEIITCRKGTGIEYKEKEKHYYLEWVTNNSKITCSGVKSFYFNDKCEKRSLDYFDIYSKSKDKLIEDLVEKNEKEKEKKKIEEKKKKLADF